MQCFLHHFFVNRFRSRLVRDPPQMIDWSNEWQCEVRVRSTLYVHTLWYSHRTRLIKLIHELILIFNSEYIISSSMGTAIECGHMDEATAATSPVSNFVSLTWRAHSCNQNIVHLYTIFAVTRCCFREPSAVTRSCHSDRRLRLKVDDFIGHGGHVPQLLQMAGHGTP